MRFGFSQNTRTVIAVFITLLIVCELIVYAATMPSASAQFFRVYVLGRNHLVANYYPDNDSDIRVGEPVEWYLGVTNNMGTVQLVSILVKISNSTIKPPDDQQELESPAPAVTDFDRFLEDNETWEFPFVWNISNATSIDGSTRVVTLQINNETYQISDWSASNGYNFRLIFELWTWQTESNTYEFGWNTNGEHQIAWLQVWFNMTNPPPQPPSR
jgi:uncharacterized membrane protein